MLNYDSSLLKIELKTSDTFLDHLEIGGDRYPHDQKSR
jgi:hypothetical protein